MKKIRVYLDMDGTIANLYNVENWLDSLIKEKEDLFLNLEPMITQDKLLKIFPQEMFEITILSMTPKGATKEYCKTVINEKNKWLDKYFPIIKKRIYKNYGYNKNLKNSKNAILVDDNDIIRENFKGLSFNPCNLW